MKVFITKALKNSSLPSCFGHESSVISQSCESSVTCVTTYKQMWKHPVKCLAQEHKNLLASSPHYPSTERRPKIYGKYTSQKIYDYHLEICSHVTGGGGATRPLRGTGARRKSAEKLTVVPPSKVWIKDGRSSAKDGLPERLRFETIQKRVRFCS